MFFNTNNPIFDEFSIFTINSSIDTETARSDGNKTSEQELNNNTQTSSAATTVMRTEHFFIPIDSFLPTESFSHFITKRLVLSSGFRFSPKDRKQCQLIKRGLFSFKMMLLCLFMCHPERRKHPSGMFRSRTFQNLQQIADFEKSKR